MQNILFKDLGLSENILKSIEKMGFEASTPVQGQTIPPMLEGRDITVQAPTGTGKTCAFGVPAIENIDIKDRNVQTLILCPTRELVIQTTAVLQKLAMFRPGVKIAAVYGGERIDRQFVALRRNPQIVVATPGRMMDHLRRRSVRIENLKLIVLDEADRMLDMGFRDDLNTILETVPTERQTALFSATLSPEIKQIARTYQKDSLPIRIAQQTLTVDSVEQFYTEIRGKAKNAALIGLLREKSFYLSLVFVGTKSMADELATSLSRNGIKAEALHGDLRQRQRDFVMDKFRRGQIEVLVATDVAARGIDVANVDAVINYDIPQDADSYVHRVGRTGRADKTGVAYTFIYPKERHKLREIMNQTKSTILPVTIDVSNVQQELAPAATQSVGRTNDRPRANAFAANPQARPQPQTRPQPKSYSDKAVKDDESARMFISLGTMDKLTPKRMLDLICSYTDISANNIGQISIYDKFSFFEIPRKYAKQVITDLCGVTHNDRAVTVEASGARSTKPMNSRKKRPSGAHASGARGEGKVPFQPHLLAAEN